MTEQDYLLAWSAYAVAALGCLLVWFRLTGWLWRFLREPLRLLMGVLLLTPTIIDPTKELFAPAIAITALDLLFKVGNNVWRAVADLALYGLIALGLYLVFAALRWPIERWWRGRSSQPAPIADDEPTLREIMDREQQPVEALQPSADANGRLRIEPRL
ncbi:MAG: MFS transporter [Pseudomonas sp.]|uniref:MFS transporter n=1 Tax=Pseudomonas sp. TaxID=306 RepID=UPI00339ADF7E